MRPSPGLQPLFSVVAAAVNAVKGEHRSSESVYEKGEEQKGGGEWGKEDIMFLSEQGLRGAFFV